MSFGIECLADAKLRLDAVESHLRAAEALVPSDLLEESGSEQELRECRELGYNHFWMVELQAIGKWLEERGEDLRLPVDFWNHLAAAAHQMELGAFIPFFAGKAARLPKRDWYDVMAAIVVLQRTAPDVVRQRHPEAFEGMDRYVSYLETLDVSHPQLFERPNADALRSRFAEGRYLEKNPPDEAMVRINEGFMGMFDVLFELVIDEELPAELCDAAWSIIDVNTFVVRIGDGLLPLTEADVWWRS